MSWSVSAVGRTEAVKQSLSKQFESAKNATSYVPHEQRSVAIIESLVNNELDAIKDAGNMKIVRVEAGGSAVSQNGRVLSSQVSLKIEPLYGFVE
jgi:hypothetical protein